MPVRNFLCLLLLVLFCQLVETTAAIGQEKKVRQIEFQLEKKQKDGKSPVNLLPAGPAGTIAVQNGVPIFALEPFFNAKDLAAMPVVDRNAPPLIRELARQALLIAAREHLGCVTRDMQIGEQLPENPLANFGRLGLIVTHHASFPGAPQKYSLVGIGIFQETEQERKIIFSKTYRFEGTKADTLPAFAEEMALASRTEFPAFLKKLSLPERQLPQADQAKIPPEMIEQQFVLDDLIQYQLVRKYHQFLETHGPNDAAYRQLALAYGHLGVLTEHFWCDMSVAFKARSLLYALRDLPKDDQAATQEQYPQAVINLAYLQAIFGRHDSALQTLATYDEKVKAGDWQKVSTNSPQFYLAKAISHYDIPALATMAEQAEMPAAHLGLFYQLLLLEACGQRELVLEQFAKTQAENPGCLRVYDALTNCTTVGDARYASSLLPLQTTLSLGEHLQQIGTLSPEIEAACDEYLQRTMSFEDNEFSIRETLISKLNQLAGKGEMLQECSSAVFAKLLQERAFCNAQVITEMLDYYLGVDADDAINAYRPLCGSHPLFPLIEMRLSNKSELQEWVKKLVEQGSTWPMPDYRHFFTRNVAYQLVYAADRNAKSPYLSDLEYRHDETYGSLLAIRQMKKRYQDDFPLTSLAQISPHSDLAQLASIQSLEGSNPEERAKIEAQFAESPTLLLALADRYGQNKMLEDQIRVLKSLIALQPTETNYMKLVQAYRDTRNGIEWAATVEKMLELPPASLTLRSSHEEVSLVHWYIRKKDLDAALKHAENAARSYSANSLYGLLEVQVLRKEYEQADETFGKLADRYPSNSLQWFKWCEFQNKGRPDVAKQKAEAYFESLGIPAPAREIERIFEFYLIADEPRNAYAVLKQAENYKNLQSHNLILAACVADQFRNNSLRDKILHLLVERGKTTKGERQEKEQDWGEFAQNLQKYLKDKDEKHLSDAEITRIATSVTPLDAQYMQFTAAYFHQKEGRQEKAQQAILKAAYLDTSYDIATILARQILRKQGREVGPVNQGLEETPAQ